MKKQEKQKTKKKGKKKTTKKIKNYNAEIRLLYHAE